MRSHPFPLLTSNLFITRLFTGWEWKFDRSSGHWNGTLGSVQWILKLLIGSWQARSPNKKPSRRESGKVPSQNSLRIRYFPKPTSQSILFPSHNASVKMADGLERTEQIEREAVAFILHFYIISINLNNNEVTLPFESLRELIWVCADTCRPTNNDLFQLYFAPEDSKRRQGSLL